MEHRRIIKRPVRYQDTEVAMDKCKAKRYTVSEVLSILTPDEDNVINTKTRSTESVLSTKQVDMPTHDVAKKSSCIPDGGLASEDVTYKELCVPPEKSIHEGSVSQESSRSLSEVVENVIEEEPTLPTNGRTPDAHSYLPETVCQCEAGLSHGGTRLRVNDLDLQTEPVSDESVVINVENLQCGQGISICILDNKVVSASITSEPIDTYQRGSCCVKNCMNDIFIACVACNNFVCYDHVDNCGVCNIDNIVSTAEVPNEINPDVVSVGYSKAGLSEDVLITVESPKIRSRRRKCNPQNWKKNKRKVAHVGGQGYVSSTGKVVAAKSVKPCTCVHKRVKLYDCKSITEEQRQELLKEYYGCGSYERQRDFLKNHTTLCSVVNRSEQKTSRRNNSVEYYLSVGGERKRVCKSFFLNTLSLSERVIGYNLKKKAHAFIDSDKRGRHPAHNKTPQHQIDEVKTHIESFPTVGPHYTRKDTNRKFLGPELSIYKMYDLYVEKMHDKGTSAVHQSVYRHTFASDYNLSFHHPKKDRCAKCEEYREATNEKRKELELQYHEHQNRKQKARTEKDNDKELSKSDGTYMHATLDLQSVLYTPCSNVSTMYYMRKLAVYNFTVYTANGNGYCAVWDETQGHRGSNEIGTAIYKFLTSHVPDFVTHIVLTSDSTVSQNRNQYITRFLLEVVQTLANVKIIEQKFLEPGHTEMEVDSMHAAIECAKKNLKVEVPTDWYGILQSARRKKPYDVSYLTWQDFIDLRGASEQPARKLNMDIDKRGFSWHKIKSIRVVKGIADKFEIKEDYSEEYRTVLLNNVVRLTRFKKPGGGHAVNSSDKVIDRKAYKGQLSISEAKKKDLMALCQSGIVSERNHAFYKSLPTLSAVIDSLPVPDISEVVDDVLKEK